MKSFDRLSRVAQVFLVCGVNAAILIVGVALAYAIGHDVVLGLTVALIGFVTFFGLLALPGACDEEGSYRESRIRLAITAALLFVYLSYVSVTIFLKIDKEVALVEKNLLPTLTTFLSVAIAFYLGSSAAVEILGRRDRPGDGQG